MWRELVVVRQCRLHLRPSPRPLQSPVHGNSLIRPRVPHPSSHPSTYHISTQPPSTTPPNGLVPPNSFSSLTNQYLTHQSIVLFLMLTLQSQLFHHSLIIISVPFEAPADPQKIMQKSCENMLIEYTQNSQSHISSHSRDTTNNQMPVGCQQ